MTLLKSFIVLWTALAGAAEPDSVALFKTGVASFRAQNFAQAREAMAQALTKPSRIDDYEHYYLGLTLMQLGLGAEAAHEFELARPTSGFWLEARLQLADLAIAKQNWSVAEKHLLFLERRAIAHPRFADVLIDLINVDRKRGRRWRVCKWAVQLYAKYPNYAPLESWDLDLASAKIDGEILGCHVDAREQGMRIRRLQWSGQSDRARHEIDSWRAHAQGDEITRADLMLAQFLLGDGLVDEAMRIYLKHYDAQKNSLQFLTNFGTAAARAGQTEAAVGAFYRAFKLSPRAKGARQALFQAAFLSYRFQDYDGAGRKFEELIQLFPRTGLSRDAKWHLAWLKYLKGDYRGAFDSFAHLTTRKQKEVGERNLTNEKLHYWMAMSAYRAGDTDQARALFSELTTDHLLGYYSLAAKYRLAKLNPSAKPTVKLLSPTAKTDEESTDQGESEDELKLIDAPSEEVAVEEPKEEEEKADTTDFAEPKLAGRFDRARDLQTVGLPEWAKWELYEIERHTTNPTYLKKVMAEYEANQLYNRASAIAQIAFAHDRAKLGFDGARSLWQATYPRAFAKPVEAQARQNSIPTELIWSIMRAESQYRPDVGSSVGALGLMQLMPFTAQQVANLLGDKNYQLAHLIEPEVNIRLGARYLRRLMDRFNFQVPLVAAAYNAGPHRVEEWLYSFGTLDLDEFIEHIPFIETRNYVKKVSRNFELYKQLYARDKLPLPYLAMPVSVKVASPPSFKESWEL